MFKLKNSRLLPSDRTGRPLRAGNWVRVCSTPNLSGMAPDSLKEATTVFHFAVGKYFVVREFDEQGYACLDVFIPLGKSKGRHTIWIEPYLLKKSNRKPLFY